MSEKKIHNYTFGQHPEMPWKAKMNKQEAEEWARAICTNGTGEIRKSYRENNEIGKVAERYWDDAMFTYGIEYGILIAVWAIYGGKHGL